MLNSNENRNWNFLAKIFLLFAHTKQVTGAVSHIKFFKISENHYQIVQN